VLVIPITGEFVIHATAAFSADDSASEKATWRDTGAHKLAKLLDSSWM
jgi:hypothetical protein